ncbi:Six-hairpin glycosidase protein [Rutstroemia sp. NJR-2017a BBW]|nr:Six-hairpin glycosidase protein [Rutstroemia sp. NJR-2017a BBW]
MPLFGRHHEEQYEPEPVVEQKPERSSSIFHRNRNSSVSAPSERSMSTVSSTPSATSNRGSIFHKNKMENDPVIAEAEQRIINAERREREADIALINARRAVKEAREHMERLKAELAEQAKLLKARQGAANDIYKRAKPLGLSARPEELVRQIGHTQQPLLGDDDVSTSGHHGHPQKPLKPGDPKILPAMISALDVLQGDYFATWQGLYPTGIDWTSAVIGTYVSAALTTLTKSFAYLSSPSTNENTINKYFSEVIGFYFGQDAFSLRTQAYDDMLWVVLGWLETIKFIDLHSNLHYSNASQPEWYGKQYIPAFAHRARMFWELASQGWDTTLCGGGMIWSPYLTPYKNAITNELYIAASISMYLYFPGDSNDSPFVIADSTHPPREPKYLQAAVEAYKWLNNSNMTDSKGLFVDGYHISDLSGKPGGNTRCDSRNEMVYTYNQGVLLTGQRGLYEATAARSYLSEGHKLIANVIAATGYDLDHDAVLSPPPKNSSTLAKWYGLGRNGILEEVCDSQAFCSQDGQTFKGIFFHHLTAFCSDLPETSFVEGKEENYAIDRKWHTNKCSAYAGWIKRNAEAALSTRDAGGRFGMWWGAPPAEHASDKSEPNLPDDAVDYRNIGVPKTTEWRGRRYPEGARGNQFSSYGVDGDNQFIGIEDLNDRGRGRTVETQGGGVSVLRALWEVVDIR